MPASLSSGRVREEKRLIKAEEHILLSIMKIEKCKYRRKDMPGPEKENMFITDMMQEVGISYRKIEVDGKIHHCWERGQFAVSTPVVQGVLDERSVVNALEQAEAAGQAMLRG